MDNFNATRRASHLDADRKCRRYVVLMDKIRGSRHFDYLFIDDTKQVVLPKVSRVSWPRLQDLVEYEVVVLKNCMYVIGGRIKTTGKCTNQVLKYDAMRNRWLECAGLKQARTQHAVAVMNDKVYVTGGLSQSNEGLYSCESYEPLIDQWYKEMPLLSPRWNHKMVVKEQTLFLAGGNGPGQEKGTNSFWKYERTIIDPKFPHVKEYRWSEITVNFQLVVLRNYLYKHMMVLFADKIFFFGGIRKLLTHDEITFLTPAEENKRLSLLDLNEAAGSSDNTSTSCRELVQTSPVVQAFRFPTRAVPILNIQSNVKKDSVTSIDSVNSVTDSVTKPHRPWKQCRDMTQARCSSGTFTLGNKIYMIGGHSIENEDTVIDNVEYFMPRRNKWYPAFSLGGSSYKDIECCILTVPVTNRDFKPDPILFDWVFW